MTKRVCLDENKEHHDVHDCCVELKTDVGRADVEYGTEDALKNHADAHGVEIAIVSWYAIFWL